MQQQQRRCLLGEDHGHTEGGAPEGGVHRGQRPGGTQGSAFHPCEARVHQAEDIQLQI